MSEDLIEIIDDALPKHLANNIEKLLLGHDISWLCGCVSDYEPDEGCDELDNLQLVHVFHDGKGFTGGNNKHLEPIYNLLQIKAFVRVKANLVPRRNKIIRHGYHYDQTFLCKVAVYYVNDNDGYTEFKNGRKIYSKKNRLVIFPSNMKHSGTTCTNAKARYVINFNFF